MAGLIPKTHGAAIICGICRPLEAFLSRRAIGKLLQTIHILGYISLVLLAFLVPSMRSAIAIIFNAILLLFLIFGGCILTKAEISYIGTPETVPGLLLEALGFRAITKSQEIAVSIIFMIVPVMVILLNKI